MNNEIFLMMGSCFSDLELLNDYKQAIENKVSDEQFFNYFERCGLEQTTLRLYYRLTNKM